MAHPRVFIVSGPSGVGKSSIIHGVLERCPGMRLSVSTTTRPIRAGEHEGRDYYFVNKGEFEHMINSGGFLEWAISYDNYYGTGRTQIENILSAGHHPLLDIDTQGVLQIQPKFTGAVYIFINPPSLVELEARLRGRGSEDEATLQKRLARAENEISHSGRYDRIIVNDSIEDSIKAFQVIVDEEQERPIAFEKSTAVPGDEVVRTFQTSVKAALRSELETLIGDHIEAVLKNDLEDIVVETYRALRKK